MRHLKTVGPLPILWDTWRLANPFSPRLELRGLLAEARPGTQLLLDLKGRNRRLGRAGPRRAAGRPARGGVRAQPRLLEPLVGLEHVRLFQSVGSRRQLRALLRAADGLTLDGVSVHERLLDEQVVDDLRRLGATVISWPVNSLQRARELARLGIHGLISDDPRAARRGSA